MSEKQIQEKKSKQNQILSQSWFHPQVVAISASSSGAFLFKIGVDTMTSIGDTQHKTDLTAKEIGGRKTHQDYQNGNGPTTSADSKQEQT